jgi:release factor glutamine methyltransferase
MHLHRALYLRFWLPIYRVFALRYVQKTRQWRSHGIQLEVPAGVFHPGIYFSTPIFMDFLQHIDFQRKKVLDIGTGSGALAIFAAKKGAITIGVDINPLAVATARKNAASNHLSFPVIESDLFNGVPEGQFDYLLVNPPYYPKEAKNDTEKAFFAGEGLSYFTRFFVESRPFIAPNTTIWMILSEDCNWDFIVEQARLAGFEDAVVYEKRHWGERLFVGQFKMTTPSALVV